MAVLTWSLQHKRDTAANFTSVDPVLKAGQLGIETDGLATTPRFKIGDGITAWSALPYANSSSSYTAGSGLTLTGSVFSLGGTVTSNIFVDSDSLANFRRVVFGGNVGLGRFEAYANDGSNNVSYLRVRPTFVTLTSGDGVDTNELSITPTNTTIRKTITLNDGTASAVLITDASNNIGYVTLAANQSIRRNAGNTAYEAFTPGTGGGVGLNGVTYTGQYKLNGFFANKSASTAWSGSIYLQPYIITNDHTITEIGAEVTTFFAASNIRLAIYQDNLGEPGALIEDSGDISADTNGFKSYVLASPLALTTSMKVVWLAIQTSTTQIGMRVGQAFNFIGKQTTGTGSDARVRAFTYGAFPNPIGTNANTTFAIAMWVRVQ